MTLAMLLEKENALSYLKSITLFPLVSINPDLSCFVAAMRFNPLDTLPKSSY